MSSFPVMILDHVSWLHSSLSGVTWDDLPSLRAVCIAILITSTSISLVKRLRNSIRYANLPGPVNKTPLGYQLDMHDATSLDDYHNPMCEKYGHVARLTGGMFGLQDDALYISDPLALHDILVRHQKNFKESEEFTGLFGVIQRGDGLSSVHDAEHKKQRRLMNPIFTASFVSKLVPVFYSVTNQLRDKLKAEVGTSKDGRVVDILDDLQKTGLEIISQGGLGHTFHSFEQDSKEYAAFHEALKGVVPAAAQLFFAMPYFNTWRKMKPVWLRKLLARTINYLPFPAAREFKWCCDVMQGVIEDLFWKKRRILAEGGISELEKTTAGGMDLATLLINANQVADAEDRMSDDNVMANMSGIVLAGQETTAGALTRILCLLSADTNLQSRLRKEIKDAKALKGEDDLNYDELSELPLLDAFCRETLRLFAPVPFVWRQTVEDCVVPLHFPVRDVKTGVESRKLLITKGTSVYLGLSAANRSTAIWGNDANELNPERWLGKMFTESTEKGVKMPGIFSNTMTFLGGGRACPGMKFGLLEIKLVLSVLLSEFLFESAEKEIDWRMGITVAPYVKGEVSKGPSVPIKIRNIA